jgi:hypothetical protein
MVAFEIDVDLAVIQEFKSLLGDTALANQFITIDPNWDSDVRWISPNSPETFSYFQSRFERLDIASHVLPWLDIETCVRMYSGFFVTRSRCEAPTFHVDWQNTGNQAFTLLTPITDNTDGFGMLYREYDGSESVYSYKQGKALILGDDFIHSTQPGRSEQPVTLLSFTFGTDKMEYWPNIALTAANQGNLFCLPDGSFQTRN